MVHLFYCPFSSPSFQKGSTPKVDFDRVRLFRTLNSNFEGSCGHTHCCETSDRAKRRLLVSAHQRHEVVKLHSVTPESLDLRMEAERTIESVGELMADSCYADWSLVHMHRAMSRGQDKSGCKGGGPCRRSTLSSPPRNSYRPVALKFLSSAPGDQRRIFLGRVSIVRNFASFQTLC